MARSAGTPHEPFTRGARNPLSTKPLNLTAWGEIRWHARAAARASWRLLTDLWHAIRGLLP